MTDEIRNKITRDLIAYDERKHGKGYRRQPQSVFTLGEYTRYGQDINDPYKQDDAQYDQMVATMRTIVPLAIERVAAEMIAPTPSPTLSPPTEAPTGAPTTRPTVDPAAPDEPPQTTLLKQESSIPPPPPLPPAKKKPANVVRYATVSRRALADVPKLDADPASH